MRQNVESAAGIEYLGKMNARPETLSNDPATLIVTVILIFTLYWSIRGLIQLFQMRNFRMLKMVGAAGFEPTTPTPPV